ncbi:MAG TPA: peptide-methionine (S)-S-oxide reductase [Planctomycetes bacterium]|nr:peptide-methionine (S)-S-oxide reductase [Planctomycetota bacterium]
MTESPSNTELATLGAGCFWCVEAVLSRLDGVLEARSGFMGGDPARTSYREVCTGTTGHAEVVQVRFDPTRISYDELLSWFWRLHDPTTRDRQGNDVGPQYRSVIFTHSAEQEQAAKASRDAAEASGSFAGPIVTEIAAAGAFHPAEEEHDDYYARNKDQGYCRMVIAPKLEKLGFDD